MPEVYRVLFEVFGMDPEDETCQPKLRRQLEDVDYVSVEFEGNKLSWLDVAAYRASFFCAMFLLFMHTNKIINAPKVALGSLEDQRVLLKEYQFICTQFAKP